MAEMSRAFFRFDFFWAFFLPASLLGSESTKKTGARQLRAGEGGAKDREILDIDRAAAVHVGLGTRLRALIPRRDETTLEHSEVEMIVYFLRSNKKSTPVR